MHQITLRDPVLKDNLKRLFQYCHGEFLDFEDMMYMFEGYSLSEIIDAINALESEGRIKDYDSSTKI